MLEDEFDQVEELGVEDLSINHKLRIVFQNLLVNPVGDVSFHVTVVDLNNLFLLSCSCCSLLVLALGFNHFPNGFLKLLLVYEHISVFAIAATRCVRNLKLILGEVGCISPERVLIQTRNIVF